jgi:hypothetical protein
MPLLDHFHPPLSRTHPWRGFRGAWAAAMARLLNAGVLPPGYYAVPFLDREGPVESTARDMIRSHRFRRLLRRVRMVYCEQGTAGRTTQSDERSSRRYRR